MGVYDLVVLGGGLAGLCAAVEAGEKGATVLLLEKEQELGGSSVLSGRYMAFAGTDMQQAAGIEDTVETFVKDMLDVGGNVNDVTLVRALGEHQLETYNWLVAHGVDFLTIQAVSGHSVPRGHTIDSNQTIGVLYKRVQQLPNVTVLLSSAGKRLLSDDSGRITQVVYENKGKEQTVTAEKGVILTSGGFSRNGELLGHFAPQLKQAIPIGGLGNKGDGLKMAWEHGAWVEDLPYLSGTYGFHPSASGPVKSQGLAFYKGAIIISQQGKRFINESLSYKLLGSAALKQRGDSTYQLWDQTVMDQSVAGDKLYDFEALKERGLIHQADTLEELAKQIKIPDKVIRQTVSDYNDGIRNGKDAFERKTLTHHYGEPSLIQNAPFYAFETKVAMLATYAGLAVNPSAQVLNPYREPIPGLYAAGEITGGFHGAGYMTGSSLGKAAVFGRIAVLAALKLSREEILE